MTKDQILQSILDGGLVAILRVDDPTKVVPATQAILEGGIRAIEVARNSCEALQCLKDIKDLPGVIPGVGTITDAKMAEEAIKAGAEFIVSPISKKEIIEASHKLGKPVFSGAYTPTEIFQAHEWGADVIKIFPAETLGMKYIKACMGPFKNIPFMPTGGVTPENIDRWLELGVACLGVGSSFTKADILENNEWGRLTKIAKEFSFNIEHHKQGKSGYY
jgi:2-dehydro-3-deoxyphosphogluconate aldolase/(4S)-4-hydroxy-2-oxoglutarate aldolase